MFAAAAPEHEECVKAIYQVAATGVRIAVGAARVEEVGVNEGDDILGEVGPPRR